MVKELLYHGLNSFLYFLLKLYYIKNKFLCNAQKCIIEHIRVQIGERSYKCDVYGETLRINLL